MTTTHAHDHGADLELSLDFVNTLEHCDTRSHAEFGHTHEALTSPEAALTFFETHGVGHRDAIEGCADHIRGGPDAWLEKVRRVRAALREVWDAETDQRAVDPAAVETVNDVLRHRPAIQLTQGRDGLGVGHRHLSDPTDEALARLAEPLVQAIARGQTDRFRVCANDECRYAFIDESRTGRRRWCDMATCGNRAKVARHRARARAGEPGAVPS